MATTQSTRAADTVQTREEHGPTPIVDSVSISLTAAITNGDIIQLVKVPKGARIIAVDVSITDVDTNGTPTITFTVGDGGDADRFITTSTIGQTGGIARINTAGIGLNYQYTDYDTIDLTWTAAAATWANGTLTASVMYRMDTI